MCKLRVAQHDRRKGASGELGRPSLYFDVSVWGALGDGWRSNLSKGQKVVASRAPEVARVGAEEGGKRQAVDIAADCVVPVGRDDAVARRRPVQRLHAALGRAHQHR